MEVLVNELRNQRTQIEELLNANANMQTRMQDQQQEYQTAVESLRTIYTDQQAKAAQAYQTAYNDIQELRRQLIEIKSTGTPFATGPARTRTDDNEMAKRVMNTNLLKGYEFSKFSRKDNYEIWIDSIKIDLFSQLPDARKFIEYAEDPPDAHCTKDKDGNKRITPPRHKETNQRR